MQAYALVDGGGDRFSGEAVRALLTEVENNRTNLMVVLAGYKDKMANLMAADEGLPRRFQSLLHLDDYSPQELAQICVKVASERFSLAITPTVERAIAAHLACEYSDGPCEPSAALRCSACVARSRQNGGLAVNLVERAFKRLASRCVLSGLTREDASFSELRSEDFGVCTAVRQPRIKVDDTIAARCIGSLSTCLRPEQLQALKVLPAEQLAALVSDVELSF